MLRAMQMQRCEHKNLRLEISTVKRKELALKANPL